MSGEPFDRNNGIGCGHDGEVFLSGVANQTCGDCSRTGKMKGCSGIRQRSTSWDLQDCLQCTS
jgi:hypothetical protein